MYALTKTKITLESAQTLIAAHFGGQARIAHFTELTDGMYNAAFLIELTSGEKTVLKVAPPDDVKVLRYEKNIMLAEVEVLRLLAAQTRVPVPQIFAYDTSRSLIDNDYFIMAYISGTSLFKLRPQLSAADQYAIDFRTGEYLRQINAIQGQAFGYFAQPETHSFSWRAAFNAMLADVLQDGSDANVELPMPYDSLFAWLQTFNPYLDSVKQPSLVHWDLWDGNIFIDETTKKITGILDCERALWGDSLMEVNFGAFGIQPALVEGYGVDLLNQPGAKVRRALYNVYLWLVMVIECSYRRFEPNDQESLARGKLLEEIKVLESLSGTGAAAR
jgi:aminoglycoside phosphotransferase (APT) family kinase protein